VQGFTAGKAHGARAAATSSTKRVEDAKTATTLEIGNDQTVCPTSTDDLSRAVLRLVEHPALKSGITIL